MRVIYTTYTEGVFSSQLIVACDSLSALWNACGSLFAQWKTMTRGMDQIK
jgi:hypothetical protein